MKIVIFPASTHEVSGKKIFFLFSVRQVEDIVRDISPSPVPFSPPYTKGIIRWREHIVPVLSLEECLGLEFSETEGPERLITVRSSIGKDRAMIKVRGGLRMLTLPIPCEPSSHTKWIPRPDMVRGLYEWEEGFLMAVRIEDILGGTFAV